MNTSTPSNGTSASFLTALRDELRSRRAQRATRKQLERQLSTYRTPAELDDLTAILARYDDEDAEPVREVLNQVRQSVNAA